MKITKSQLKKIIKEELKRSTVQGQRARRRAAAEREETLKTIMDPSVGTQAAVKTAKPAKNEAMLDVEGVDSMPPGDEFVGPPNIHSEEHPVRMGHINFLHEELLKLKERVLTLEGGS